MFVLVGNLRDEEPGGLTRAPVYPNLATSTVPPSARGRRNVPWAHDARTRVADAARKKALSVKPMLKEEKQKRREDVRKGNVLQGITRDNINNRNEEGPRPSTEPRKTRKEENRTTLESISNEPSGRKLIFVCPVSTTSPVVSTPGRWGNPVFGAWIGAVTSHSSRLSPPSRGKCLVPLQLPPFLQGERDVLRAFVSQDGPELVIIRPHLRFRPRAKKGVEELRQPSLMWCSSVKLGQLGGMWPARPVAKSGESRLLETAKRCGSFKVAWASLGRRNKLCRWYSCLSKDLAQAVAKHLCCIF